jgi:hypothetical protein
MTPVTSGMFGNTQGHSRGGIARNTNDGPAGKRRRLADHCQSLRLALGGRGAAGGWMPLARPWLGLLEFS